MHKQTLYPLLNSQEKYDTSIRMAHALPLLPYLSNSASWIFIRLYLMLSLGIIITEAVIAFSFLINTSYSGSSPFQVRSSFTKPMSHLRSQTLCTTMRPLNRSYFLPQKNIEIFVGAPASQNWPLFMIRICEGAFLRVAMTASEMRNLCHFTQQCIIFTDWQALDTPSLNAS